MALVELPHRIMLSDIIEIPENMVRTSAFNRKIDSELVRGECRYLDFCKGFVPEKYFSLKINTFAYFPFGRQLKLFIKKLSKMYVYAYLDQSKFLHIFYNKHLEFLVKEIFCSLTATDQEGFKGNVEELTLENGRKMILGHGLSVRNVLPSSQSCILYFEKLPIKYKNLVKIIADHTRKRLELEEE